MLNTDIATVSTEWALDLSKQSLRLPPTHPLTPPTPRYPPTTQSPNRSTDSPKANLVTIITADPPLNRPEAPGWPQIVTLIVVASPSAHND